MADTFRLRVLKEITELLKGITPDNGFQNDLSDFTEEGNITVERVIRGRDRFGIGDSLPFVSILEDFRADPYKHGSGGSTSAKGDWKLLIQGFIQDDPVHKTDPAYGLAGDVVRALAQARKVKYNLLGFGGQCPCVNSIQIDQPVIRPADNEISSTCFFFLIVTVNLVEDLENP